MKNLILFGIVVLLNVTGFSQNIPNLPVSIGVGSAEVWGDSIYHFGGGTNWGGSTRFAAIYKYDGINWQNYALMPDNDVWGISTTIKGDSAFVYGGYAFGNNKLRIYNFVTNTWVYAANSPNISATSGHTIEYVNGFIYLFFNGAVYKYSLTTNSWTQATSSGTNANWLHSTVYQDVVYLVGWANGKFIKYNTASDQWMPLADLPNFVTGSSLQCVDDKIYNVGGSSGPGSGTFNNTLMYDIALNQWTNANIYTSSNRAYMADVVYKNNFYVIGGLESNGSATNSVELIFAGIPSAVETDYNSIQNFELSQNYPNPFNPSTTIRYTVPNESKVSITVFNLLGQEVATLVNETKSAGSYLVSFEAGELSSGIYLYKISAGNFIETKKMILIK